MWYATNKVYLFCHSSKMRAWVSPLSAFSCLPCYCAFVYNTFYNEIIYIYIYTFGAKKSERERERPNFKYVRSRLNRSRLYCPIVRNYSIKSCHVDRLGQYLNSAYSDYSSVLHFRSTSVLLTSVEYCSQLLRLSTISNSKQLPVSLYDFYGHCHIVSVLVFVWSLAIIVPNIQWIKIVQVLNRCSIVISFLPVVVN